MTQQEIIDGLKEVLKMVKPSINTDNVTIDARLLEDVGLDSLTMLLTSMGIESKFNMRFDDSVRLTTVRDVVECVEKAQ